MALPPSVVCTYLYRRWENLRLGVKLVLYYYYRDNSSILRRPSSCHRDHVRRNATTSAAPPLYTIYVILRWYSSLPATNVKHFFRTLYIFYIYMYIYIGLRGSKLLTLQRTSKWNASGCVVGFQHANPPSSLSKYRIYICTKYYCVGVSALK